MCYKVLPAGEFIRFVLAGLVEVEAELCIDPKTEVIVHLHNLRDKKLDTSVTITQSHLSQEKRLNRKHKDQLKGKNHLNTDF